VRAPTPSHPILLIPGPTEVHPEVAAAAATPMIGHRGAPSRALIREVVDRVGTLIGTKAPVLPLGCSATGAMEATVRNLGAGPVLHCVNGAFSARWSAVREACGIDGDRLEVEWGEPITAAALDDALRRRRYSAVTVVHSETSTGVLNPLPELAEVVRAHDDVLLFVDAVTSMAAVELRLDEWGVDVCFAGSQKALALPPGLTLCSVSERAVERARHAPGRGFYFDFVRHVEALGRDETPTTPPLSLLYQLRAELDRIDAETPATRYERHRRLQRRVEEWAAGRFGFLPREGFRSPIVSVVRFDGFDVTATLAAVRERGWWVGAGYGPTRDRYLRIGHLGEIDEATLERALHDLDACSVPASS
jgi:aspartate aminotransferase-like enzyme